MTGFGRRRERTGAGPAVDLSTRVGDVALANPVMTASGTAGHGDELGRYVDLAGLGAVVVKSESARPWPGNAAPRVHETPAGMINAVGLQGGGVEHWLAEDLPPLLAAGATVVASIWGTAVEDYARAAELLAAAPPEVVAVEINVSCPNHHARGEMFAHSEHGTAEVVAATAGCGRPRWVKLSPNVTDLVAIARAAAEAGADAVTLINTVMGMVIDPETRRPVLGNGGGGCRGRRSTPSPCGRCTTCTPPCPSCRSWGWAVWRAASTPSSCCWREHRPCRWARPPSPIRVRPSTSSVNCKTGALGTGSGPRAS